MSRPRKPAGLTAAEFKSELRRLNLTQLWIAEQIGFAEMTISKWGSGELPVPQYVWYILQLLDRLAYRGEVSAVHDQVEAFVRLITSQTLAPSAQIRDASPFELLPKRPVIMALGERPFRVTWHDPRKRTLQERWYDHETAAYRRKRTLQRIGIEATVQRNLSAAA